MNLLTIIATINIIIYAIAITVYYHKKHKVKKPLEEPKSFVWHSCDYYESEYNRIKQHNDSVVRGGSND